MAYMQSGLSLKSIFIEYFAVLIKDILLCYLMEFKKKTHKTRKKDLEKAKSIMKGYFESKNERI